MSNRLRRCLLVYDQQHAFFDALQRDPRAQDYPLLHAKSALQARETLGDRGQRLVGLFVSPENGERDWLEVVQASHELRPALPIYLLLEKDKASAARQLDLRKMGIREAIEKPISLQEILELVAPIALSFDAEAALESARKAQAASGDTPNADIAYTEIRAEDFLSGTQSFFDVFVRVGQDKYIKLLQAGDSFTRERLESYLKKGVRYFYVRKEVQSAYLSYCTHLATGILQSERAPVSLKTAQTLNQGEQVMRFLKRQGVSESNLLFASQFVENVRVLTQQLRAEAYPPLKNFLSNVASYEHGVGTSLLSSMLARELDIIYEKSVKVVGLAALLHDIGLPAGLDAEDESKMDEKQRQIFRAHPEKGAESLSKIQGMEEGILQAVAQHHMRRKGPGFPETTPTKKPSLIAEIVGVSEAFNRLIATHGDNKEQLDMLAERILLPGFSSAVSYAFRSVFYAKLGTLAS